MSENYTNLFFKAKNFLKGPLSSLCALWHIQSRKRNRSTEACDSVSSWCELEGSCDELELVL